MTDSAVIETKKLIAAIVDLQSEVIKIDRTNVLIDTYVLVETSLEMSIDSIAIAAYGTNDAIDVLCKFNGISNPLSIKSGDVIAIPVLSSLFDKMSRVNVKPMMLSKLDKQILKTSIKKSSNASPSKKKQQSKSFSKSADGIIVV